MARKNADLIARTDIDAEAAALSPEEVEAAEQAREAAEAAATSDPLPTNGQSITLTFAQLKDLLGGGGGITAAQIAQIAAQAAATGAEAVARKKRPEIAHTDTERRSAYNPEGEKDHPRPKLKCPMYFGSAPLGSHKEVTTLTHREIAALNRLTPGHFKIVKLDGSQRVIEVKGQYNSNRQIDRLWILLPEGDDQQNLYPSLAVLAESCTEATRVQPELVA